MGSGIDQVNRCDEAGFVELLGAIFEHSPWVPAEIYTQRPFASRDELYRAMVATVGRATTARRLQLLRSHPELAGSEAKAGTLTNASRHEQSGAGLNQCSAAELHKIQSLNRAYRERFGFPFIIAVTGLDKHQIIASMECRLANTRSVEFDTALDEVDKIARIRIDALIDE